MKKIEEINRYMDSLRSIDEAMAKYEDFNNAVSEFDEWEEYCQMKQVDVEKEKREKIAKLLNIKVASGGFTESDVALILAIKKLMEIGHGA